MLRRDTFVVSVQNKLNYGLRSKILHYQAKILQAHSFMEKAFEKLEKNLWLSYSKGLKLSHTGLGNSVAMRERVINSADFNLPEVILSSPLILAVGELWLSALPPDKGLLRSGWQVEPAANSGVF